jgi:hypothetical protein
MRRLVTLGIALAAIVGISASSFAGSMSLLGAGKPAAAGGGGGPSITAGSAHADHPAYTGSGSIPNMNGGVNFPAGSRIIIGVFASDSTLLSSPQIGGVNLNLVGSSVDKWAQVYEATAVSATGDTLTFSNGTAYDGYGFAAVYTQGLPNIGVSFSVEEMNAQADPQFPSSSLTVPAGGYGIVVIGSHIPGAATGLNWDTGGSSKISTASGDNFDKSGTAYAVGMAHTAVSGAGWVPSVSPNSGSWGFTTAMLAITIGP